MLARLYRFFIPRPLVSPPPLSLPAEPEAGRPIANSAIIRPFHAICNRRFRHIAPLTDRHQRRTHSTYRNHFIHSIDRQSRSLPSSPSHSHDSRLASLRPTGDYRVLRSSDVASSVRSLDALLFVSLPSSASVLRTRSFASSTYATLVCVRRSLRWGTGTAQILRD